MILVVPFALIAYRAAIYMRDTLHVLEAPGIPVELKYKSKSGDVVRLLADRYFIDLRHGYARVQEPRLIDPSGGIVASVDYIEVRDLKPFRPEDQIVHVRAAGVSAKLTRLRNGQFDVTRYLPESKGQPTKIPFEVTIDRARAELVDLMGAKPWRLTASTPSVNVSGMGQDWVAGAVVTASGIGKIPVRLQNVAGVGIQGETQVKDLELTPILAHFQTTDPIRKTELANASAESVKLSGPVRVFVGTGAKPRVETRVKVRVRGAKFHQYAVDDAVASGLVTTDGFQGEVDANLGPNQAKFNGNVAWTKGLVAGGRATVSTPNVAALPVWVRTYVPKETTFQNGRFNGWVTYRSTKDYGVSGDAVADEARYGADRLSGLDAHIRYIPGRLVADVRRANYQGQDIHGAVSLNTAGGQGLSATVVSRDLDLAPIAKRFGIEGLSGRGTIIAAVAGTMKAPEIRGDVYGSAAFQRGKRLLKGRFDLSGAYTGKTIEIQRALLNAPFGVLAASGTIGKDGSLGIDITGRGLAPRVVNSALSGRTNITAHVGGTARDPKATGYLEAYNFQAQDYLIPAVSANFAADLRHAEVRNFRATRGTGQAGGNLAYRFKDGGIDGNLWARGLQIADFVGEEVAGTIDVPNVSVHGTVEKPVVEASITGRHVVARGLKLENVGAEITSDGRVARVDNATADVAGGSVKGSARYNLDRMQGTAEATLRGITLADVVPKLSTAVAVEGQVAGNVRVAFSRKGLSSMDAAGRMRSVVINGTSLGNGPWAVAYDGKRFTGNSQVGSLDRYVSLDDASFDPNSQSLGGQVTLFNSRLQDLVAISTRYFPNLSYDVIQSMKEASGTVNLAASVGGTASMPSLDVKTLEASDLTYRSVNFGRLTASLSRTGTVWDIHSIALNSDPQDQAKHPVAILDRTSATIDEKGDTKASARLSVHNIGAFANLVPQLSGMQGEATFDVDVDGATAHPDVQASLSATNIGKVPPPLSPQELEEQQRAAAHLTNGAQGPVRPSDTPAPDLLGMELIARIDGERGRLSLGGSINYYGFNGQLEGDAPFQYPFEIPKNGQVKASFNIHERDLLSISSLAPVLNKRNTAGGKISGQITASGTADNLNISGGIHLVATKLGLEVPAPKQPGVATPPPIPINTYLKDLDATVGLANGKLSVMAGADSSRGGRFDFNASTPVPELHSLVSTFQDKGLNALLDNPLDGEFKLSKFAVSQDFPKASDTLHALMGLANGKVAATADGAITLDGTLGQPSLTGRISMSDVQNVVPTILGTSTSSEPVTFDPKFDVRLTLAKPALIKTTAAEMRVLGGGRIQGSRSAPNIRANLQVEDGKISLPGATVRLVQGGTVTFIYEPTPDEPIAQLNVDMEGQTSITAQRFTDQYERYDITLGVKGDLLKENGLNLTAESSPNDLSQERILALLGQVDLLSRVATGGIGQSDTKNQLRDALAGYALPSLTSGLTNAISDKFKIDVYLEYNAFEQASVAFVKSLPYGFFIQGRRQIGEPPPGFQPLYDIRLVYRPRRVRGVLSRVSFSIGADQDRPFKIAFEYGTKF